MKVWTCWPALVDSLYLLGALSAIPQEDPRGSDGKQVHFSTRAPAWIEVPGNARHWTYRTVQSGEEQPRSVLSRREIVVVGGSAAGLFTAASVARGGRPVRVLESKPQLEPAPRTLIVTDHFRSQMTASAQDSIINEIRRFELFTDGRSAQIALKKPDLIIERSQLIR